jgi:hypothetical protein
LHAELVVTNEWGWESSVSVDQLCCIMRLDQFNRAFRANATRAPTPSNVYFWRYLLDNHSRAAGETEAALYNKLKPSFRVMLLPGPTDRALCTLYEHEHTAGLFWSKVHDSLKRVGQKTLVSTPASPGFLTSVAAQMPACSSRVTTTMRVYEGIHSPLMTHPGDSDIHLVCCRLHKFCGV